MSRFFPPGGKAGGGVGGGYPFAAEIGQHSTKPPSPACWLATYRTAPAAHRGITSLLAAVLHLGNIEFEALGAGDAATLTAAAAGPEGALPRAARLLGVSPRQLGHVLTSRRLLVSGAWLDVPLTVDQARVSRDGLARVRHAAARALARALARAGCGPPCCMRWCARRAVLRGQRLLAAGCGVARR